MSIDFICPSCYAKLIAPDSSASRNVKCPKLGCGKIIQVPPLPLYDVFISYSSKDKTVADSVCSVLESYKVRCWVAPRDVLPGRPYAERLTEALSASRIIVLILSSHSNNSPHVLREIEQAVENGIPVIPFRIEDIRLTMSLEYYLKPFHWLDAYIPPVRQHLGTLVSTVENLLDDQWQRRHKRSKSKGISKRRLSKGREELPWADEVDNEQDEPQRRGGCFSTMLKIAALFFTISVLLVLGFCGLSYYLGTKAEVATTNPTKKPNAPGMVRQPPPPTWKHHTSEKDMFQGYFPDDPIVDDNEAMVARALKMVRELKTTNYSARTRDGTSTEYFVCVHAFQAGLSKTQAEEEFLNVVVDLKKINFFRVTESSVNWVGANAKELTVENSNTPGAIGIIRFTTTQSRGYFAGVMNLEPGRWKPEEVSFFFDNFSLTE